MKKILLTLVFSMVTYIVVFSQTAERESSPFQLSLFPPLSTNGINSYQYSNKISLNLLAGLSRNENGIAIAGLTNIIINNAKGLQFAGLGNVVKNDLSGVQFAGLANIARNVKGLQFAGLINKAENVSGVQFAGLINVARDVNGLQFAGLINKAKNVSGVQFAGLINVARDLNGLQFAGLINKAKNINGVQFAGLINIAEKSDYPIGLINIIKNGEKGIAVTYNEIGSIMATFRSGGRITYGIIGVGYNHKTSGRSYVTEAGFGIHINCLPWLRINNELKVACFGFTDNALLIYDDQLSNMVINTNYSILPAFKISPHIELFGGPSLNYMNSRNRELEFGHTIWKQSNSTRLQQIYIGYQVGIQYIF